MKIGFYGSSFCHAAFNNNSIRFNYNSYIEKISKHYNAELCHIGESGCGVWDVIITQFKELLANPPDVAIFAWPNNATVFHRKYRHIHKLATTPGSRLHVADPLTWDAVCKYYESLYDNEKDILEYKSALMYFDTVLLPQIKNKTKIIHMWEYGMSQTLTEAYDIDISNSSFIKTVQYPIKWTTGQEIIFPMMAISAAGQWPRRPNLVKVLWNDPRCNHLDGEDKNNLLYNWIVHAIDNYENGVTINKVDETVSFYNKLME